MGIKDAIAVALIVDLYWAGCVRGNIAVDLVNNLRFRTRLIRVWVHQVSSLAPKRSVVAKKCARAQDLSGVATHV